MSEASISADEFFDAISDGNRRRVLALLASEGELCVCELTEAIAESQPKISRHLAIMKDAGLVIARRDGTWMHYRLALLPGWATAVISNLDEGGVPEYADDLLRLKRMRGRPARCN